MLACLTTACADVETGSGTHEPACTDCEPAILSTIVFGRDGPGVGAVGSIVRDNHERYYLTHVYAEAEIEVYSNDGTFVQTLGRSGSGPGEYTSIYALDVVGDSLHVFDGRTGRQTVLTLAGSVVRTRQVTDRISKAWVLPDGRVLVHAVCFPGRQCAEPLHLFDDSLHVVSFGAHPEEDIRRSPWTAFAPDDDGIWVARRGQYSLYRWSYDGLLLDSIHRSVPWFPPHEITPFREGIRPGGIVRALHLDDQGRLWSVSHIADDRWAAQFSDAPSPDMRFNGNYERYYDSVVEVIDPKTGRLLASRRYDENITRITNAGELVIQRLGDDGTPLIELWRVAVPQ